MKFKLNQILAAVAAVGISSSAFASAAYVFVADTDNTGDGGIFLRSEGGNSPATVINMFDNEDNGVNDGLLDMFGRNVRIGAQTTTINSTMFVNGQTNSSGITNTSNLTQTGITSINTQGASGTTIGNASSTTTVLGTTNINQSGGGATNIGSASSTNTVLGTTNINATGAAVTNIGTGGSATNIGGTSSTNTVLGTTNITGTTSINTNNGGLLNTTIGNAANTTTIQSGTNIITGANNSMTATVANNIQGPLNNIGTNSTANNNIGTNNSFVSTNRLGSTNVGTSVTAQGGNSTSVIKNNVASTSVVSSSIASSNLTNPTAGTSGGTSVVLKGANSSQAVVDANGKISHTAANATATESTAALTLTNGLGNTHGLVVTESQTTLSGGTQSSSMTLTDRAATFSNAQTGAPITVTGVANGRADFDAVNVRQFAGAIAAVSAQANIPALAAGQDRNFGVGVGHFMGKSALAMGMSVRGSGNSIYRATLSSGLNAGTTQTVVGVGAAWGF